MLTAEVLAIIEEFTRQMDAANSSPGFTYGLSGNVPNNSWLLCDTVPSNKSARPVFLYNATLLSVYIMNETESHTFTLGIYEHEGLGSTFTLKHTTTFPGGGSSADRIVFDNLAVPVALTTGKALGIKVTSGSGKNITAGLLIKGNRVP